MILRVLVVLSLARRLVMVVLALKIVLIDVRLLVVFVVIDVLTDGLVLDWSDERAVVLIEVHLGVGVFWLIVFPIEIAVMIVRTAVGCMVTSVGRHVMAYAISVATISAMSAISVRVMVAAIRITRMAIMAAIRVAWIAMMTISVAMSAVAVAMVGVPVTWNRNDSVVRMSIHSAVVVRSIVVLGVCPVLDWVVRRVALVVAVDLLVM